MCNLEIDVHDEVIDLGFGNVDSEVVGPGGGNSAEYPSQSAAVAGKVARSSDREPNLAPKFVILQR